MPVLKPSRLLLFMALLRICRASQSQLLLCLELGPQPAMDHGLKQGLDKVHAVLQAQVDGSILHRDLARHGAGLT